MNLCVLTDSNISMDNSHLQLRKINKWALKLIGVVNTDVTHEDLLEFISLYVSSISIQAFFYDSFNNFYTLFLNDIDSFCHLCGKKAKLRFHKIKFLPLLDFYVVDNVYPFTTNDDLSDTFGRFGNVFQVTNYHILPNSSKFSHVLSGKREISFTLPGEKSELFIPINVFHGPYKYHIKKLCSACNTEGHSVLDCPDIEDDVKIDCAEKSKDSSDSELDSIVKSEFTAVSTVANSPSADIKDEIVSNWTSPSGSNTCLTPTISDITCHTPNASTNTYLAITASEEVAAAVPDMPVPDCIPHLRFPSPTLRASHESIEIHEEDNLEKNSGADCSEGTHKATTNSNSSCFIEELLQKRKYRKKSQNLVANVETQDSYHLKNSSENNSAEDTSKHERFKYSAHIQNKFSYERKHRKRFKTCNTSNNGTEEESDEGSGNDIKKKRSARKRTSPPADASTY